MADHGMKLDVAGRTDIGLKRKRNEDHLGFRIPEPGSPQHAQGALFVVADGMGGMGGGDVASQTAVAEIFQRYYADPGLDALSALRQAIEYANTAVRAQAEQVKLPRIGSTAAGLALLPDGEAVLFNVGDSRVYRVQRGFIELLSRDQSVLQHQIDAGLISAEEARGARNVNVTAFIGQPTPIQPVFNRVQAEPDDVFLLCSDGLWDLVEPQEMLSTVRRLPADAAARRLIELARQRGGPDNITVIIVRLGPPPKQRRRALLGVAMLAVVAMVAAGAALVLLGGRGADDKATPTPAARTAAALSGGATLSATRTPTNTAESTKLPTVATAAGGLVVLPSDTPTVTLTPTDTSTPAPTSTPLPTRTPSATHTPSATATPTETPSATPSATPTATFTATRTPTATITPVTPTATRTPQPSPTGTPVTPTVTLDLSKISPTPSQTPTPSDTPTPTPSPTPTPTPSQGDAVLHIAAEEALDLAQAGVYLSEEATYYIVLGLGTENPEVRAEDALLPAGTRVLVLSADEVPLPDDPEVILRQVQVFFEFGELGESVEPEGWLRQDVLERAIPVVPHVFVGERGAHLYIEVGGYRRYGAALAWGERARLLAKNRAGTWYRIALSDGRTGWVQAELVEALGRPEDLAGLPVQTLPPLPPPPPTFTPYVAPTEPPPPADGGQPPPAPEPTQPPAPPQPTSPPESTRPPEPTQPPEPGSTPSATPPDNGGDDGSNDPGGGGGQPGEGGE